MRFAIAAAVFGIVSAFGSVVPTDAAMMHMMMHHKAKPMHMHMTKCKGEFMMMDMKAHKCVDTRYN